MITSLSNQKVKDLKQLQKSRERKRQNLFIIEGIKEIEKAEQSGYWFESVFYCEDIITQDKVDGLVKNSADQKVAISKKIYSQLAYREDSGGVIVCARAMSRSLKQLQLGKSPLLLILESVEKPGNLGAILRTADAAGIDAVIVCDPQTDPYNPNVIRSSLGCIFTVPLAITESAHAISWLREHNISAYCAALTASVPYTSVDFKRPAAIVMGTESTGLTDTWLDQADQNIIIPMRGIADSMNVSTSAAVILFEAIRQRTT